MATQITAEALRKLGFTEVIFHGHTIYIHDKYAITQNALTWISCNIEFGTPCSTNVFIDTIEELEKLIKESHIINGDY